MRHLRTASALRTILASALLLTPALATPVRAQTPDYLNPDLPIARRVDDLVGRMTLQEKISQMQDRAAAIPRLRVPEYNWWNEALHGVARAGVATVFPQAIGFASTWDTTLIHRMATAISDEARAKYEDAIRKNNHERYYGLTIWSPNINLFRDPRWGRGQETYGEDPFLTGQLAVQFVRGLEGNDPKYLKTVSTVKHFAVHSGPEPLRHTFDVYPDARSYHEYYLRQFQTAIEQGGAYSVMCSYNALDGLPTCSNPALLQGILRTDWKFPGYVVSDCGAVQDIYRNHKQVATAAEAAAVAVKAGTDLECGGNGYAFQSLGDAVKQGLISEARIDTAVKRLFTARFRLGMFDPPARVPWQLPMSDVDSPAHQALALQVARESIVLLKNEGKVLPLSKTLQTIAVIGPNSDEWRMLLGNYNGTPSHPVTPLQGIKAAVGSNTRVIYEPGSDLAQGMPLMSVLHGPVLFTPDGKPGLEVEYFRNHDFQSKPAYVGVDSTVNANWREGAPRRGMDPDDFAVRWTGTFRPNHTQAYRLGLIGTMKFSLFLDDSLLFRSVYATHHGEYPDPRPVYTPFITLDSGSVHTIRVEAEESYGDADLQLLWSAPHDDLAADAVAAARQADAVILCLGLTARLEGEQMAVDLPGFEGGDRTSLGLPQPQEELLEKVASLGKPTVLVLLNGSALAVDWAREHVPAIVEAWYPGQAGGTAIADVLFGDYNPSGRLPVTFYRSVKDLPPFTDYNLTGRTYQYFSGDPLYPFGYGLSYTSFTFKNLTTSAETLPTNGSITVKLDVTNTGQRAGAEVVELYVKHLDSRVARPIKELKGFARVELQPGATRSVEIPLRASDVAYWDPSTSAWVVEPDHIQLQVGSSSADVRLQKTIAVVGPQS